MIEQGESEERVPFDDAVDRVLRALQAGDVVTYGDVADEAGYPRRGRAVGQILARSDGRYPWWRVVTSTGRLVPGHEDEHARRLTDEGHRVENGRVVPSTIAAAGARFDQAYFDRWYRDEGFGSKVRLARKVDYAIAAAEYVLDRPVRRVLDVGCGEGAWHGALRKRRPDATYLGVDPSRYAVERYGKRRNLRLGRLGELDRVIDGEAPFDLIVCVDVVGYVTDAEAKRGLRTIADRLDGVALMEIYVQGDDVIGDTDGYRWRRPATFDRWFAEVGLSRIGPHLYVGDSVARVLTRFERT